MINNGKKASLLTLSTAMLFAFSLAAVADTLSCANGNRPICLGYGEKIVGDNSVCFDRFECSDEGFVCKSELNGLAEEQKELINKHNALVKKHNELVGVYEGVLAEVESFRRCVALASTLEDARACGP